MTLCADELSDAVAAEIELKIHCKQAYSLWLRPPLLAIITINVFLTFECRRLPLPPSPPLGLSRTPLHSAYFIQSLTFIPFSHLKTWCVAWRPRPLVESVRPSAPSG